MRILTLVLSLDVIVEVRFKIAIFKKLPGVAEVVEQQRINEMIFLVVFADGMDGCHDLPYPLHGARGAERIAGADAQREHKNAARNDL